jgi:23S rRNA pseudouridine1911/1915/1917 synthase
VIPMAREFRSLSIPEGVDGERIDTALTRVLGLSRTVIARLLESDEITSYGKTMLKSEKVSAGQVIEILMPDTVVGDAIPFNPA